MSLIIKTIKEYSSSESARTRAAEKTFPLSILIFFSGVVIYVLEYSDIVSFYIFAEEFAFYYYVAIFAWVFFGVLMYYHLTWMFIRMFIRMFFRKTKAGMVQASRDEAELADFPKQIKTLTEQEYAVLLYCYQRNIQTFAITPTQKTAQELLTKSISGLLAKGGITHHPREEKTYQIAYDLQKTRTHILDLQKDFDHDVIDAVSDICAEDLKKYKG